MMYTKAMFKIFTRKNKENQIQQVAEKQLKKNVGVIESLRDYDAGKKDISTDTAKRRLPDIRVAS